MKVNDANSELLDYSKRLDKRLRNETKKKEQEIKDIDQLYDKKIEVAKINGEEKYINSLKRNEDLVLNASEDYRAKLTEYKDNLAKTQSALSQEELSLKDGHVEKLNNLKTEHQNSIHEQFRNANETHEAVNSQMKRNVMTITDKAAMEKGHIESKSKTDVANVARDFQQKSAEEERQYRFKLKNDARMHNEELDKQQKELKDLSNKTTEKNKRLVTEKMNVQAAELNYLDSHQKDIILQKQNDFKVRYDNMVKEHTSLLSDLKKSFETDLHKMVEETSTQKRVVAQKSEDPFYRIETLAPKIIENPKEFMVSLNVPEHEKENVHLSVRGRGVKMTLSRRFAENFEEKDGSLNRSTKNELFSREFPSKDLLNPKLVDQKYENGVLTYRIQKL